MLVRVERKRSTCDLAEKAPVPTQEKHVCSGDSADEVRVRSERAKRVERALTEEAPLETIEVGDLRIGVHHHGSLGIPPELAVDGSDRLDEPVVVLEEAIRC